MHRFWREAVPFLNGLANIRTIAELQFCLGIVLQYVGVERYALTLAPRENQTLDDILLVGSVSHAWKKHYCKQEYLKIDPAHRLGAKLGRPFLWKEAFQEPISTLRQKLLREIIEIRAENTLIVPLQSSVFAGLAWLDGIDLNRDEHRIRLPFYRVILNSVLDAAASLRGVNAPSGALTSRQRDVLSWVAEGKSTQEVAAILQVSPKTIDTHVTEIMHKLDASSRTHAVAIALRNRILN